jgi:hypothetical protein
MRAGFTVKTQWNPNSPRLKKARQVKSKVKSMFIIFRDIKRILHKEFVLADQTVNSAYYCDILWRLHENVPRLRPELWQQKNWLLHHDCRLSPTQLFSVSPIEDNTRWPPF